MMHTDMIMMIMIRDQKREDFIYGTTFIIIIINEIFFLLINQSMDINNKQTPET